MAKSPQRLVVVEERPEIRALVVSGLSETASFRVVGVAPADALEAVAEHEPDVLVYGSGGSPGSEEKLLRSLREGHPDLPIVLFSPCFSPGQPAVRVALALGGCTRLPCVPARYSPENLPDLVRQSLAPWIGKVILRDSESRGLHMEVLQPEDARFVRELIRQRMGVALEAGRELLLQVRLAPLVKQRELGSVTELVRRLRKEDFGRLHREAIDAVLSKQASFFDDPALFEALRMSVLPTIVRGRGDEHLLSVWCAACGTGQEPYSLAMILDEHFPELGDWEVRIVASDASRNVVRKAESGSYDQLEVSRGVPIQMLGRHFERSRGHFKVKASIRKRLEFRTLALVAEWPDEPPFDLVILRDVLVYFADDVRARILDRLRSVVVPGGFLLLGGGEVCIHGAEGWRSVALDPRGWLRGAA